MGELLSNFSNLISNNVYIALVVSFLAGIVSSFSPCILSTLPLVIGYVGELGAKDKKAAFKYSLFFSIGVVITFTALGVAFSLLGKFINITGKWWYLVLGVIMLLVGLVEQLSMSDKTMLVGRIFKIALGILVIIMGLYLLYLGF